MSEREASPTKACVFHKVWGLPKDATKAYIVCALSDLLPEKTIAERLSRSVVTLRAWRRQKKAPPFYYVGGAIMYRWPEVEAWLEARRHA